jgi:hypothetical protein
MNWLICGDINFELPAVKVIPGKPYLSGDISEPEVFQIVDEVFRKNKLDTYLYNNIMEGMFLLLKRKKTRHTRKNMTKRNHVFYAFKQQLARWIYLPKLYKTLRDHMALELFGDQIMKNKS